MSSRRKPRGSTAPQTFCTSCQEVVTTHESGAETGHKPTCPTQQKNPPKKRS